MTKRSYVSFQALALLSLAIGIVNDVLAESIPKRSATASVPATSNQLWIVSTRNTSYCNPSIEQTSRLKYYRSDVNCRWQPATLGDLLSADDPAVTTLFYIHENRVTRGESFQRAHAVFDRVSCFAGDRPFRLIAIAWPADRISCRPRPDVQAKAHRSEAHGFYVAWLIDQMNPDILIGLFGYSFGPRMITTALHYLGGGSIRNTVLANRVHPERRPVRATLMAAALDAHWLIPGQRHGNALTQVDQMLVLVNSRDKALRWYPRLYRGRRGPHALGYVGLSRDSRIAQYGERVSQWNVTGYVGRTHSWSVYEGSSGTMSKVVPFLLGD